MTSEKCTCGHKRTRHRGLKSSRLRSAAWKRGQVSACFEEGCGCMIYVAAPPAVAPILVPGLYGGSELPLGEADGAE